jgi:hypothetical protein
MPRTYTEEESASILALQEALHGNPKTRASYLKLVKEVAPNTPIPEIDVPAAAMATIKPQLDKVDKLTERFEASERRGEIEREWAKHNVTATERTEIERLMTDRLIGDVATAVEYYRTKRVQAAAPRPGPSTIGLPGGKEGRFKGLFENPDRWARERAYEVVNEIRAQ